MNPTKSSTAPQIDLERERRLHEIRQQAEKRGVVKEMGARPAGAPFPVASAEAGYYGVPLLKEPQWTWEIPIYFFLGGAAGSASVIGAHSARRVPTAPAHSAAYRPVEAVDPRAA